MSAVLEQHLSKYEQERGKPMPSQHHGIIQMNLGAPWVSSQKYRVASELTLDLGEKPFLTPDLSVFLRVPISWRHDKIRVSEPPLLVVEILSPTQGSFELMQRIDRYFAHGVKSCWVVYPTSQSVTIHTTDGAEQTITEGLATDPVTGLTADLGAVFS